MTKAIIAIALLCVVAAVYFGNRSEVERKQKRIENRAKQIGSDFEFKK